MDLDPGAEQLFPFAWTPNLCLSTYTFLVSFFFRGLLFLITMRTKNPPKHIRQMELRPSHVVFVWTTDEEKGPALAPVDDVRRLPGLLEHVGSIRGHPDFSELAQRAMSGALLWAPAAGAHRCGGTAPSTPGRPLAASC